MKFFTDPVAIVLEADILHVSIVPHEPRARLRWKRDLGVPKYSTTYIYLGPYLVRSEIRAVALLLARQLSSIFLYIYIMPLHALPSDVTTVIHDLDSRF